MILNSHCFEPFLSLEGALGDKKELQFDLTFSVLTIANSISVVYEWFFMISRATRLCALPSTKSMWEFFRKFPEINLPTSSPPSATQAIVTETKTRGGESFLLQLKLSKRRNPKSINQILACSAPSRLKNISYQFVFKIILNFHQMET